MDYVTVLRAPRPINKRVHIDAGQVVKTAGAPIVEAEAITRHVPDANAMAALLAEISEDPNAVLVQGYQPDMVSGEPYTVMSYDKLRKIQPSYESGWVYRDRPCIARLKKNFQPSSWWQLDRDYADGIPEHLAALTNDEFVDAIDSIMHGFANAGRVHIPSTSNRVLCNGQPIEARSGHIWFQITDPTDCDFGDRLKLSAALNGLGFPKRNKAGATTLWAIFDPTVFSWERISYEGQPLVSQGLELAAPDITVHQGARVDTRLIPWPTQQEKELLAQRYRLHLTRDGNGRVHSVIEGDLTLETVVQTARGGMTPIEFMRLGVRKLRCQATFRDSESWNGILFIDGTGLPCLFDNGTRIKYELSQTEKAHLTWALDTEFEVVCN